MNEKVMVRAGIPNPKATLIRRKETIEPDITQIYLLVCTSDLLWTFDL